MPLWALPTLTGDGRFAPSNVDQVGGAVNTMFTGAIANDMHPVIYSKVRGKAYAVEHVQVDDVPDVIRSRRFNEATHKYLTP